MTIKKARELSKIMYNFVLSKTDNINNSKVILFDTLKTDEEKFAYVLLKTYNYFNKNRKNYDIKNLEVFNRANNNALAHMKNNFSFFEGDKLLITK